MGSEVVRGLLTQMERMGKEAEDLRAELRRRDDERRAERDKADARERLLQAEVDRLKAVIEALRDTQQRGSGVGEAHGGWVEPVSPQLSSLPSSPNAFRPLPAALPLSLSSTAISLTPAICNVPSPQSVACPSPAAPPPLPLPRRPVSGTVLTTLPVQAVAAPSPLPPPSSSLPTPMGPPSLPPRPAASSPTTSSPLPPPLPVPAPSVHPSPLFPSVVGPMSSSSAPPPFPSPITVESMLDYFHATHHLSECHLAYLAPFLSEALDSHRPSSPALLHALRQLEQEVGECEYELVAQLGSGGFGDVYEGRRRKGVGGRGGGGGGEERVAVKVIDLESSDEDVATISQEVLSLSSTRSCPQLIDYYGCCVVHTHSLWLLMELVPDGSLLSHLQHGTFHEDLIAIITQQILLALQYMAAEGKIHRDVKAANILVNVQQSQVKLIDLGAARQLTETVGKANTVIGSPYWMYTPHIHTQKPTPSTHLTPPPYTPTHPHATSPLPLFPPLPLPLSPTFSVSPQGSRGAEARRSRLRRQGRRVEPRHHAVRAGGGEAAERAHHAGEGAAEDRGRPEPELGRVGHGGEGEGGGGGVQ